MVLGEDEPLAIGLAEPAADLPRQMQFLLEPHRHGLQERAKAPRRDGQVCFQQSFEFQERLVVEAHIIELRRLDARLGQAETVAFDVTYRLKDVSNDKFVMTDKATARVTVDTTSQRYARLRAIRDAENKAAQVISEQIRSRIASYFLIKT